MFSRRAAASAARRDFPTAISDFSRAIELEPSEARNYFGRAQARLGSAQPDLALADINAGLRYSPGDAHALAMRGAVYLSMKDSVRAQADFDAAEKLAPDDGDLMLQTAAVLRQAGVFEPALRRYDGWIAAHPKAPSLAVALEARCRARGLWGKNLDQALADCDASIAHGFKASSVLDSRALVLLRMGRLDDAIRQYDAAITLQPKSAWSLYGRGLAKLRNGSRAEGQIDLQAALAIQPNLATEATRFGLAPEPAPAEDAGKS